MKIKKPSTIKHKNTVIMITVILLVAVGAAVYYFAYPQANQQSNTGSPVSDSSNHPLNNDIDYNPPTEEEVNLSQEAKKDIIKQSENDNNATPTESQSISVGIASAYKAETNLEVRAFTPDIIEGGGICTAILTNNNLKVTDSSEAFVDASTSQCRPIYIPLTKFTEPGVWRLTVTYKSDKYSGVSPEMDVEL